MERFNHYFENHIAKIVDLDSATIIDYYNPDYGLMYNLRFTFDKKNCTLSIYGDFGDLIAHNFYNLGDYRKTYEHFCGNPSYFVEKITSSSRNIYTYDYEEAKSFILERLLSDDDENKEEISEKISELLEYFSDRQGFQHISDESREWLSSYDSDYWEWIGYAGKNVSNIIYLYLDAYRRAYEYLTLEEENNGSA
ncbi:TPA: hypothetical protein ACINQE_000157 [Streptococcus agalactiae]|uniref:hypothetical protein n=1 Tax=Streptococcus agalactiae TaxID=1311 RepID=UPI0005E928BF|nr:hypothetical protein [Streptococcus agalactiae]HEP3841732.1 hypothetical protein [Streptococcus pyogenes]CFQ77912.1 Uncharacterised protein [Streptococcus agalactiae]CNK15499.1 Uncharacterised protein [Streptococcus agalactiae]CQJ46256.1 Uncharacterised protein [Streptococcus agalactiae]HEN0882686.1 hypothetical protein [Streptococcus agalactiae]